MTHTDTHQAIQEIMESLSEHIEYDQLVNKLVDKNIITPDEVAHLNMLEDKVKTQELIVTLLGKDSSYHPLVLKIIDTLKTPCVENTRRADQAIEQAASAGREAGAGSRAVCRSDRRILSTAEVSSNWELKNFLYELSKDISTAELDDMKDLMRGESGFKENITSKIERPMKFFQQLVQTGRLNAYNLHFLQALVRRIGRRDLNARVREFCLDNNKNPIHFFTPSEQPENGYKYVRHHIEGDIDKLTHIEKERLRAEVANVLCVPVPFVFIKGIEPTASILITFMVPEDDVRSFIQIYVKEGPSSLHMSIHIHVEGEELSFAENPPSTDSSPTPIFQELRHLLEREQNLEKQLEDRDEKLMVLQERLEVEGEERTLDQYDRDEAEDDLSPTGHSQALGMYKSLASRLMDVMATMQPNVSKNGSSLSLASASATYQGLLEQTVEHCGMDQILLNKLLDARALVENIMRENTMKKMQDIIRFLTGKVEESTEVSGAIDGGSSSFLQDSPEFQAHNRQLATDQHQKGPGLQILKVFEFQRIVPVIREEDKTILAQMTMALSKKDRRRLRDFLCFSDAEKEELKKDYMTLLELAVLKECRGGGQEHTPLNDVLRHILAKIKMGHMVNRYFTQGPMRKSPTGSKAVQTQLGDETMKSPTAGCSS